MPRIVVAGGGVIGLSTALMLTKAGHQVTVLERDATPVPDSPDAAWQAWERRGVAQFRQPHYLHAGGRCLLDARMPEVTTALLRAGGVTVNVLGLMPPFITDRTPREGDERFVTVTGRRPVIEYAVGSVAEQHADIRRGVSVTELLTGPAAADGIPHVTGVRTSDGEELRADLFIDAMGRRSPLPAWLAAIGARDPAEEAEDSGFVYYSRYFRSATGSAPRFRAAPLMHFDSYSLLTLPGDDGTWSVTVYISSHDQALKELRHPANWAALVAACPLHAHLLDGEPITEVLAMSGIVDRSRRFVLADMPVATGVISVGDSSSCTNPSLGRGMTMGLIHAAGTAEVIGDHLGDPLALARAHDQMTRARLAPWHQHTIGLDRARRDQINASIDGRPARPPEGPAARVGAALPVAMMYDADVFRAFAEITAMLSQPHEVMARPGFAQRVLDVASGHDAVAPPGPSRADVLRMLA